MSESGIALRLHDGLHGIQHANFKGSLQYHVQTLSIFYVTLGIGHIRGGPGLVSHGGGVTSEKPAPSDLDRLKISHRRRGGVRT